MALYFPINRLAHNGVQLSLPFDQHIPLYPVFILPYLAGSLLFVMLPVWAAFRGRAAIFQNYAIALLLVTFISLLVYTFFPTYVVRPGVSGNDFFSEGIALLYRIDGAYNAAPSGHASYSTLAWLFLTASQPKYRIAWTAGWLIILSSTLFTRQHNILDMLSGIALAGIAYLAADYISKKRLLNVA